MLAPGALLQNRYTVIAVLGQGGMGAVYLAEDLRLARHRVALKENLPDPTASPQALSQARQQFAQEASILASLDHPNLPKVFDYFAEGGREYLVMDYIEGDDLETVLRQSGGPLPEVAVLGWADQLLGALEYLHAHRPQPILHRDIKPANVRLARDGTIKLVDFGLVKLLDPNSVTTKTMLRGLGTPEYAPLEQYATSAGHTDTRSDLYSLAATLYHLLTNVAPPDVHQRLLNPALLQPPQRLNPRLSAATGQALMHGLEIQPPQRWQSAAEMRRALHGATLPPGVTSSRDVATRALLPILVVLLIGIATLGVANVRGFSGGGVVAAPPTPAGVAPTPSAQVVAVAVTPLPVATDRGAAQVTSSRPGLGVLSPVPPPRAQPTMPPPPTLARPTAPPPPSATPIPTTTEPPRVVAKPVQVFEPEMVRVPASRFLMGSNAGAEDEKPPHTVMLDDYFIGKTEITNAQYQRFVQAQGHRAPAPWTSGQPPAGLDSYPVVDVSWEDAQAYAQWLARVTGKPYRLPTEAEWEKACGGTDDRTWPWGNRDPDGGKLNACDANCPEPDSSRKNLAINDGYARAAPVGSYPQGASPYEALDMAGNVWEWVADWYDAGYYASSPPANPTGPPSSAGKVLRSGAWSRHQRNARCANRDQAPPNATYASYPGEIGFRVALSASPR